MGVAKRPQVAGFVQSEAEGFVLPRPLASSGQPRPGRTRPGSGAEVGMMS
jgi:hypothetical protein